MGVDGTEGEGRQNWKKEPVEKCLLCQAAEAGFPLSAKGRGRHS